MSDNTVTAVVNDSDQKAPLEFFVKGEHHPQNGTLLGFWIYLMSDCLIFACLFATYGVLGRSYAGGPTGMELFDLNLIAISTSLLLISSITYGFAMLQMQTNRVKGTMFWLAVTGLLGAGPQTSGFWTAFFALVGTHGLHVFFGIVWLVTLLFQLKKHGLIPENKRRVFCLSMFWHFLDVVWIGVFTYVYLMGVLP